MSLDKHPNWKGGRHVSHGYIVVKVPGHHLANASGYAYEHRLIAEQILGRPLKSKEVVHHLNGDGTDNRQENLAVYLSNAHHRADHRTNGNHRRPGDPNPIIRCDCGCGLFFLKYDQYGRPRRRGPKCGRRGVHRFDTTATVLCACGCGTVLLRFDCKGRERKFISGHNFRR
jgi:hypothetical protein